MKRPGIVTGLACFNLLFAFSEISLFTAKIRIGVDPIFFGSALPVRLQWDWLNFEIIATLVTTAGFFRGSNWARWSALVVCILDYITRAPLENLHLLPVFFFALVGSLINFSLIFFSPKASNYFNRRGDDQRKFTMRGALGMATLIFALFTCHAIFTGILRNTLPIHIAWIAVAAFLLPTLLLNLAARWNLEFSLREISALLIAVCIFIANQLSSTLLIMHFLYPGAAMPHFDWFHCLILATVFGAVGLLLMLPRSCVRDS